MITSVSKEGITRRMFYSQSLLMVNKTDSLSFQVEDKNVPIAFQLNFTFSDEGDALQSNLSISPDGKVITIVLHKWIGTHVENTQPLIMTTKDQARTVWFKWRTTSNSGNDFRSFDLSIWVQEK